MSRNCAKPHRNFKTLVYPTIFFTTALIWEKDNPCLFPNHLGLTVASCQKTSCSQLISSMPVAVAIRPLLLLQRITGVCWVTHSDARLLVYLKSGTEASAGTALDRSSLANNLLADRGFGAIAGLVITVRNEAFGNSLQLGVLTPQISQARNTHLFLSSETNFSACFEEMGRQENKMRSIISFDQKIRRSP